MLCWENKKKKNNFRMHYAFFKFLTNFKMCLEFFLLSFLPLFIFVLCNFQECSYIDAGMTLLIKGYYLMFLFSFLMEWEAFKILLHGCAKEFGDDFSNCISMMLFQIKKKLVWCGHHKTFFYKMELKCKWLKKKKINEYGNPPFLGGMYHVQIITA